MIPAFEEIRIENTNACVLNCIMCPRQNMTRTIGRMTFETFVKLCQRIKLVLKSEQLRLVDLHGFGEPLLDFELPKKIQFIHENYPQLKTRIVTSMSYCTNTMIEELLHSGLHEIVISHYATSESEYQRIHGRSGFKETRNNINTFIGYNIKYNNPIHITVECLRFDEVFDKKQELNRQSKLKEWFEQFPSGSVNIRRYSNLHNWGSAFAYQNKNNKTCSIVNGYRERLLQITWAGDVIPCCFDYNSEIILGNLLDDSLEAIFTSHKYKYFIECHKTNKLELFPPCRMCQKCFVP